MSAWKLTAVSESVLVSRTRTQSPTLTCSTRGSGDRAPERVAASSSSATKMRPGDPPSIGSGASMAETANSRAGAPGGQIAAAGAGTTSWPGNGRSGEPSPGPRTRRIPQLPSASLTERPL